MYNGATAAPALTSAPVEILTRAAPP